MKEEVCKGVLSKTKREEQIEYMSKLPELKDYEVTIWGEWQISIRKKIGSHTKTTGFLNKKTETIHDYQYTTYDKGYKGIDLVKLGPFATVTEISVRYEPLYEVMKKVGKKFKYRKLIKCWVGAE